MNLNSLLIALFINIEYRDFGLKVEGTYTEGISFVVYLCENRYNN